MSITIDEIETLAANCEAEEQANRNHLLRMVRAYVRILANREPGKFTRRATHHGDEAGHFDSSFPPDQVYSEYTGPKSLKILDSETEDIPTSGGYYYDWRRVTTYGGLWVDMHGQFLRGNEEGTGAVGSYAAHPGDHCVDCSIDWSRANVDEVTTQELAHAEAKLRPLAFPHIARLEAK